MTSVAVPVRRAGRLPGSSLAREIFWLGVREIRTSIRTPAAFLPGLLMPVFFYFVMVGAIGAFAERFGLENYKAFQVPVSILFAVTSGSAGLNMVADIESGYFEKLLATPVRRLAILVGAMGADVVRIFLQALIVTGVALASGMDFATGLIGAVVMCAIATVWGTAYSAIGFAIALKSGNSQATQSTWALFVPATFLTTAFAPKEALSGWLRAATTYNPLTYVLDAMRSLSLEGWSGRDIGIGLLVSGCVGVVTITLALRALLGRVR